MNTPTIYQTMTGELQCVVIDGVLYVRQWESALQSGNHTNPNPWRPAAGNFQNVETLREFAASPTIIKRRKLQMTVMIHALLGVRASAYKVTPQSETIRVQIGQLQTKMKHALEAEQLDVAGAVRLAMDRVPK